MDEKEVERRLLSLERRVAALEDHSHQGAEIPLPQSAVAPETVGEIGILSVDSRIVERNEDYEKNAWKVELHNLTDRPLEVFIQVEFLDAEGFALDEDNADTLLAPGEKKALRGYVLMDLDLADQVNSLSASAKTYD